jgi:hypothetical protein
MGVEAVAEGMADHVVGHHSTMPGVRKAAQAVVATRRFEDSLHASMMTITLFLCKMMAALSGAATGKLTKAARSGKYWAFSARSRILCLLVGLACVVATVIAFLSIFPRPRYLTARQ